MEKNNFDFLRVLFAFIVVIKHTIELTGFTQLYSIKVLFDSNIAISSFFIISGFLVTRSCCNTNGIGKFFEKRARRLLPAYITVIIICVLLFSFISSLSLRNYFSSWMLYKYLFANIFF
jgi:peptidoglycan/LPS O-acetylase OafA/YrhL